ncbi:MAG TPA: hypothetical protein VGJ81_11255 [Thermoanaerobaculia bacterium]|jgi:hypothetical protein
MHLRTTAFTLFFTLTLPAATQADLTIEAAKAVSLSPPGDPKNFPVEVHVITSGVCTFDLADNRIIVPRHDKKQGHVPAHKAYLLFEESELAASSFPDELLHIDDKFTGRKQVVYPLDGDELSISTANTPDDKVVATVPAQGTHCPVNELDVSMHWVPSLSSVLGTPVEVDRDYLTKKNDQPDKVAGTLLFAQTGRLDAHVIDKNLYEFVDDGRDRSHMQAIAQLVDYTFRATDVLVLNRKKGNNPPDKAFLKLQADPTTPQKIYLKLANTPDYVLEGPMPSRERDEHWDLHYDMVRNAGNHPIPTPTFANCTGVPVVNCQPATGLCTSVVSSASFTLSVGGLDCGPDGLP